MTSPQKSTHKILAIGISIILIFIALVGCSSISAMFPVPPITPTVHVPQVSNGLIAFTARQADGSTDIYTMNPDGSNVNRLTDDPGNDNYALWTPDGKQIFYVNQVSDCISVMNADGTNKHCLPPLTDPTISDPDDARIGIYINSLVWSPNQTKIAFANGTPFVFIMNPDGTDIQRIPADEATDLVSAWPAWSPDGTQIALGEIKNIFTNDNLGDIYIVDADGSNLVRLNKSDAGDPHWTPDGTHLIFQSERTIEDESGMWLYVIDLQGKNERRLISLKGSQEEMFWGASPDGTKLLILSWMPAELNASLLILDAKDYSVIHMLSKNFAVDEKIHWSPDSQQILYMDRNQRYHIMNIDGTEDREIIFPFDRVWGASWQPVWK